MKVQEILTNRGYRFIVLDDDYNVILPVKSFLKFFEYSGGESIACPVAGNQEIVSINLLWLRYHGTEKSSMLLCTADAARH